MREVKENKLIFILGVPRSGTTILSDIFSLHPDIIVHDEDDMNFPMSPVIKKELETHHVVQKMPKACLHFELLMRLFKDAFFIITQRENWNLVLSWRKYSDAKNALSVFGLDNLDKIRLEFFRQMVECLKNPCDLSRLYIHVTEEFQRFPIDKFKRLCEALRIEPTEEMMAFVKKHVKEIPRDDYPLNARSIYNQKTWSKKK